MSSLTISSLNNQYPGKSDKEIALELTNKYSTIIAIVRYKNSQNATQYTNFGTCESESEIQEYFDSAYCHETELLIDLRVHKINPDSTASLIKSQEIVEAFCDNCLVHKADERSLTLNAGNNFYVCAGCQNFYCENCLNQLPLSEKTHGMALCPFCKEELIRALPGAYFKELSFKEQLEEFSSDPSEKIYQEKVSKDAKSFFKKVKSIFNKDQ